MLDLNSAPEQRPDGVIPDGTFCKFRVGIIPHGLTLPDHDPDDFGIFKPSNKEDSDVVTVHFEFTVTVGPHIARKIDRYMTVKGGAVDEKGQSTGWNISKRDLRAIAESAMNINPKDQSQVAVAKRNIKSFKSMNGWEFGGRVGIEPGGEYPDKNRIAHFVVPGEPEYVPVMSGQELAPKPSGNPARARSPAGSAAQAPAWKQGSAAPAASSGATSAPSWETPQPQTQPAQPASPTVDGPAWLNS